MTREMAIEELQRHRQEFAHDHGWNYSVLEALQMGIEALQKDQNWIPVIVKLPEEEEKPYWVCLDDGYQCECRWTNNMYGVGTNEWSEWGWHIMDKPQYSRVVAWMPLPEPYKPKESE